jgi:hypothetical protein
LEAHLKVAEANLKVKDAELAEAKVWSLFVLWVPIDTNRLKTKAAALPEPKTPTLPKGGLAASKYADVDDDEPGAAEGEQDSSSAALASVRKPFS